METGERGRERIDMPCNTRGLPNRSSQLSTAPQLQTERAGARWKCAIKPHMYQRTIPRGIPARALAHCAACTLCHAHDGLTDENSRICTFLLTEIALNIFPGRPILDAGGEVAILESEFHATFASFTQPYLEMLRNVFRTPPPLPTRRPSP